MNSSFIPRVPGSPDLAPWPVLVFRILCLITALANSVGNIFLLLFYKPLFQLLHVPMPADLATWTFVCGFSFTVGILAFLVFLDPVQNVNLLTVGAIGKGIYAFFTFYFYVFHDLNWFYLIFGVWDAAYTVIFMLFLTKLLSSDLTYLNSGVVLTGADRPATYKALLLGFTLTKNGSKAFDHLRRGLEKHGYQVTVRYVEPEEDIYVFPMSLWDFIQIIARAFVRWPSRIKPLDIPADHDYDLIVVESQTWMVGMAAPVEAIFQNAALRPIFAGRDVAAVNVARGAWRRSQAMIVRWLEYCGGNLVGVRAYTHTGWEPSRLFSLWFYLIYHKAGMPRWLGWFVQPHYGPSDADFRQCEQFGADLAQRKRTGRLVAAARA